MKRRFLHEQHVLKHFFDAGFQAVGQLYVGTLLDLPCLSSDPREQVGHPELMLERHQRDEIARLRQVAAQIGFRFQTRQILRALLFEIRRAIGIRYDRVPHVML